MEIARRNWPDVAACLLIAAFGLAVAVAGFDYEVGTLTRMGPGFFPVMLGLLVFALAAGAAVEAARSEPTGFVFRWRPLIFVSLGVLAWALLIEDTGIIPSSFALVGISSMARSPFRPLSLVLLAVGLCLIGYFIFIGLGMPLTMLGR